MYVCMCVCVCTYMFCIHTQTHTAGHLDGKRPAGDTQLVEGAFKWVELVITSGAAPDTNAGGLHLEVAFAHEVTH
jgi:hypothetical protein